jgi:MtrB/PioB family decaheme-associated outer membrane protein
MDSHARPFSPHTAIAAALLAALGPALALAAESEEVARLTRPQSAVEFGLGYADNDGRRFGQYNGVNERGAYGLFNADIVRRDDALGSWLKFTGRNLGLENRELRFEHEKQGDWRYFVDYSETPRFEPLVVSSVATGVGTPNLTLPTVVSTGTDLELKTKREAVGLGFDKLLPGKLNLQVRFRNEDKNGARISGRGTPGGGVVGGPVFGNFEFAPEPINSTTRQFEATLAYSNERLQLAGGYYGTTYNNQFNGLTTTGGAAAALASFNPIALPPDTLSHQFHLAGGYSFTPTTRGNFKIAYTKATQDDTFISGANVPLASGISNNSLQGRIDTTLVQLRLTARPLPKLSLRANLGYEDVNDKTPILPYFTLGVSPTSTFNGNNEPHSFKTTNGKLEASYALPMGFRLTGGLDYEEKKHNFSPVRVVTHRDKTEETSYRVEMRRSMSETVTGVLAYIHSERDGSPYRITTLNGGAIAASGNRVAPINIADRDRDKVRLSVNWTPAEPLSLQFAVDESRDNYAQIHALGTGPRKGEARNYSADAAYTFSEKWQGTAWISRNESRQDQWQHVGTGTAGLVWAAALRNVGDSFGLGVRGKPNGRLEVGADLSHSDINDENGQQRLNAASPATVVAPLPDVSSKVTKLNLFGKYALQKNSGIRLDYVYDRFSTDDFTWATWSYVVGTRVLPDPVQKVQFVGASYYYRFQ